MKKFKFQKKTSDCQDRIEAMPELYAEFQALERANLGTYLHVRPIAREDERAADKRMEYLDKLFGFEAESQMRKVGVESSHWAGRR